jgi:hypothetical protein
MLDDVTAEYIPTVEQIAQAAAEIRGRWSEAERLERCAWTWRDWRPDLKVIWGDDLGLPVGVDQ